MKNSALALALVAILIQSTHAQQNIPDEINYKPYYQAYLTAKAVSDKKRAEADKAQNTLIASQKALQAVVNELNNNATRTGQNQEEIAQLTLNQQALDNQIRTNDANIRQNQAQIDQNNVAVNNITQQLRGVDYDFNNTRVARDRAENERRGADRDNDVWENKLKNAEAELDKAQKALRDNNEAIRKANREKDEAQDKLVKLTQARTNQEEAIARSQNAIEPAKKQIAELTPKVEQKSQDLNAATARQKTAQDAVDRDQRALDALIAQNGPLNDQVNKLRTQVASVKQVIEQQKALYATTKADLDNAKNNFVVQNQKKDDLTQKQKAAEQRRDGAKAESDRLTAQRTEDQKTLAELNRRLAGYTRGQQNDPAVIELRRQIADVTAKINTETQQINDANAHYTGAVTELNQIAVDLPKVNAEIARLNDLIVKGPATLEAIQNRINEQNAKLEPLAKQLADLETQLAAIAPQQNAAEAQLRNSKTALDNAKAQTAAVQNEYNTLSNQLKTAQAQLKQAQDTLAQNQTALEKTKKEITGVMTNISTLTRQIGALNDQTARMENDVRATQNVRNGVLRDTETSRQRLRAATERVRDLNRNLDEIAGTKRRLENDMHALNDQTIDLQRAIQNMQVQSDNNIRQIASYRQRVSDLNAENANIDARNRTLAQSQTNLQAQVNDDQDQFTRLDQLALTAETATESKNQEYLKRKNRYDTLLADAQKAGTNAGEAKGNEDGTTEGEAAGVTLGTKEGNDQGKAEGLLYGFNAGKAAGEAEGFAKGREKGEASTEDYQRGYKAGLELGKADAQAEADRVDYPKGKAEQFAKLTATLPAQSIKLDQETKKAILAAAMTHESGRRLKLVPQFADRVEACEQNYIDFKNACLAAYKVAYDQSKAEAFEAGRERTRPDAREAARKIAFEANKNVRYKEGYDLTYGPAYQAGLKTGQETAEKRGIAEGKAAGYKASRDALGLAAHDKGVVEMTQHFATNAVTLVKSARLNRVGLDGSTGGAVGASDLLKLELTVANHGAKNSGTPPVKVEMNALTKGIVVRNTAIPLVSIPANTTAVVSNVLTAQVLESSTAASQEQVKVRYTDEMGNVQEQVLKVEITPNLQVSFYNVDYDSSPKPNRSQKVTVTISNDGNLNPTDKVTLGLSTAAPQNVVRVDEPEIEVSRFNSGKRIKVKGLLYTVLDEAALRAGITMTVYVKHGARVVAKQDFQVKR